MKIAGFLAMCLIALLIAAALFVTLAPRLGWRVDVVFTGSMEPELGVGSLAVTCPVAPQEIEPGHIISFYSPLNGDLTSHRVIEVDRSSLYYFRTKGDANEDADPFVVLPDRVVGRVSFHVPFLGYIVQFVKSPMGLALTLFVPGLIIIAMEVRSIWRTLTEEEIERRYRITR